MLTPEEIYVIPSYKLVHIPHGFTRDKSKKNIWSQFDSLGIYINKESANNKNHIQQLMSYLLIKNKEDKYLSFTNNSKLSLGLAQHVSFSKDINNYNKILSYPVLCSLSSIVNLDTLNNIYKDVSFVGYVRDMLDINGKIGCVYICEIDNSDLLKSLDSYEWVTKDELIDKYHSYRTWDKFIIDYMVDKLL